MDKGVGKQKFSGKGSIRAFDIQYTQTEDSSTSVEHTYDELVKTEKKTWGFPIFPLELLDPFKQWLMYAEGKLRSENTAKEICVDISKCLRFHHNTFSWDGLLNTSTTMKYMNVCEKAGVQADGLITKCDRVVTALTYMRMELTRPDDHKRRSSIDAAIERVGGWKRVWRQSKGKGREVKLAQSMESVPDLTTTTAILGCKGMWDDIHAICRALEKGEFRVEETHLKICTAAIAAVMMYKSVQRPSAIMGLTTEHNRSAFVDGVWVILVEEHKTGKQGPARLTLSDQGKRKVDRYVEHVRPACDPLSNHAKLLSLPGGRPVTDVNKLLKKLEKGYKVTVPTSTHLRKQVATKAALQCSSGEVALLSRKMSHSIETHKRAYEEHMQQKAYKIIRGLVRNEDDARKKRIKWTPKQIKNVEVFFREEIENRTHATLYKCREFLTKYPIPDRVDKHVQDKVKNIINSKN